MSKQLSQNLMLAFIFALGAFMWAFPVPEGLTSQSWHLLIIFFCTILGVVLNPLPMGAITSFGALACILTKTLTVPEALSGFADEIVWLIVFAFFISDGFVKTGLGNRIASSAVRLLGQSPLGLAYSLVVTDLILAPVIPSVAARGGGIIFPIANSLAKLFSPENHHHSANRTGGFLMSVCYQSNVITSSMFLTALAANSVAVKLAAHAGITISWADWAIAGIVPGLICLAIIPLLIYYYLYPPENVATRHQNALQGEAFTKPSPLSRDEILMIMIFFVLIFCWVFGKDMFGITPATGALIGYSLMILFRLVGFEETIHNKAAWHTFIWFAHLVMMSGFLAKFGVMVWFVAKLKLMLVSFSPMQTVILLCVFYYYVHYVFASAVAHMTVFFPTFVLLLIDHGVPPQAAAQVLIFLSVLSAGLTHFGLASAPVFFSGGYIKVKPWYYVGFMLSLVYITIWTLAGGCWWKILGLW